MTDNVKIETGNILQDEPLATLLGLNDPSNRQFIIQHFRQLDSMRRPQSRGRAKRILAAVGRWLFQGGGVGEY